MCVCMCFRHNLNEESKVILEKKKKNQQQQPNKQCPLLVTYLRGYDSELQLDRSLPCEGGNGSNCLLKPGNNLKKSEHLPLWNKFSLKSLSTGEWSNQDGLGNAGLASHKRTEWVRCREKKSCWPMVMWLWLRVEIKGKEQRWRKYWDNRVNDGNWELKEVALIDDCRDFPGGPVINT